MGAITFYEKERIFQLDTPKSTYAIGIVDEENFVGHVYYGKKIKGRTRGLSAAHRGGALCAVAK